MGLTKASHVARESVRVTQLLESKAARLCFAGAGIPQLLIALVEMLGELFDDLRFARGTQSQRGEPRPQVGGPIDAALRVTHGRLL